MGTHSEDQAEKKAEELFGNLKKFSNCYDIKVLKDTFNTKLNKQKNHIIEKIEKIEKAEKDTKSKDKIRILNKKKIYLEAKIEAVKTTSNNCLYFLNTYQGNDFWIINLFCRLFEPEPTPESTPESTTPQYIINSVIT